LSDAPLARFVVRWLPWPPELWSRERSPAQRHYYRTGLGKSDRPGWEGAAGNVDDRYSYHCAHPRILPDRRLV